MKTDPAFPALAAMMGNCFHQDMDLEAETVPEAVALYGRGLPTDAVRTLQADIDSFRQRNAEDLDGAFLLAFGDDLDPRDAGFSVDDFLRMVGAVVEDPASFRQFLEEDMRPEFPQLRRLAGACGDLLSVSAEARRLGRAGASSLPHAVSIHLGTLQAAEKQALLGEMQQFDDLHGDRATEVFGKRWLVLDRWGFESFSRFKLATERIAANPEEYRNFVSA